MLPLISPDFPLLLMAGILSPLSLVSLFVSLGLQHVPLLYDIDNSTSPTFPHFPHAFTMCFQTIIPSFWQITS